MMRVSALRAKYKLLLLGPLIVLNEKTHIVRHLAFQRIVVIESVERQCLTQ